MSAPKYKKISSGGRLRRSVFTTHSLWEGPDHLLMLETDSYMENYRRFFFRDIQSITVRRDRRWSGITIFFCCFIGLGLAVFLSTGNPGRQVFWGVWMGAFLIPLLYNFSLGPTCVTHIRTAIQFEEIQGLRRLRKTEAVIGRIRNVVAATQPLLTQEQIMAGLTTEATSVPAPVAPPPLPTGPPPLPGI